MCKEKEKQSISAFIFNYSSYGPYKEVVDKKNSCNSKYGNT